MFSGPIIGAIAGAIAVVLIAMGGYKAGYKAADGKRLEQDLARADKVIKVTEKVRVVETKVVKEYITTTRTIEKETENVIHVIHKHLDPGCVLPDGFGMLLVAAANGIDPENGPAIAPITGPYGCVETAQATLRDLEAGRRNTALLKALQQRNREIEAEAGS